MEAPCLISLHTLVHMSLSTALTSPESNDGKSDIAEFSSFANLSELKPSTSTPPKNIQVSIH